MVSPTTRRPTNHLSLTDGTNTLLLTLTDRQGNTDPKGWQKANSPKSALRVTQANEGYGDFELPFSSIVQSNWAGGRGNRDLDTDNTRFYDAHRIDTRKPGEVRAGPSATLGQAFIHETLGSESFSSNFNAYTVGWSFTPSQAVAVRSVTIKIKCTTWTTFDRSYRLKFYLWDDGTGAPGALRTVATVYPAITSADWIEITIPISSSLSAARYWAGLELFTNNGGITKMTTFFYGADTGENIMTYTTVGGWVSGATDSTVSMTLNTSGITGSTRFFDYKGMTMAVTQPQDLTAPRLWVQGYFGVASSNSADKTKLNMASSIGAGVDVTNKVVKIVGGLGYAEDVNWRVILSNTTTVLTCSPTWNIVHDGTTIWNVVDTNVWTEVTGHGLSAGDRITDVLVVDDIIYFCRGEGTNVRKGQYTSSGWSTWADDGTNKFDFMSLIQNDTGDNLVWGAKSSASSVAESDKVAFGSPLVFRTALVCGDTSSRITNMIGAKVGNTGQVPVVFKETGFGAVAGGNISTAEDTVPKVFDWLRQFPEVRDSNNGKTAITHDVYLWFSLLEGIERYYDGRLDDIGPNRDEGLPAERRGTVSVLIEYASRVYAAIDGGQYGYSCILEHNGIGWHEMYRSPGLNQPIRGMGIQVIPGLDRSDRLWFSSGEDIYWMPLSLNPGQQQDYTYAQGTGDGVDEDPHFITSWINGPYKDLACYWHSVTLFTKGLVLSTQYTVIMVHYQLDNDTTWTAIQGATPFATSPVQELQIGSYNITGKRIRFKVMFRSNKDTTTTAVLYALRVNAVTRVKPKGVWNFTCTMSDGHTSDLNGDLSTKMPDGTTPKTVDAMLDILEAWQDGSTYPAPLTAVGMHGYFGTKYGFVDMVSVTPLAMMNEPTLRTLKALITFTFIEAG